jgi:hypothetical protein
VSWSHELCCVQLPPRERRTRCDAIRGQPSNTHVSPCCVSVPPLPVLHQVQRSTGTAFRYPLVAVLCFSSPPSSVAPGATQDGGNLPTSTYLSALPQFPLRWRRTRCDGRLGLPLDFYMSLHCISVPPMPASHQVQRKMEVTFRYLYVTVMCPSFPHAGVAPGATQNGAAFQDPYVAVT